MNPFKTAILPTAEGQHKDFHSLSCSHKTTFEIGDFHPVYYRKLLEGDEIDVDFSQRFLTSPLKVPAFGSLSFRYRAFFCPYRLVFSAFEDFLANQKKMLYNASYSPVVKPWFFYSDYLKGILRNNDNNNYIWDSDGFGSNEFFSTVNLNLTAPCEYVDANGVTQTIPNAFYDLDDILPISPDGYFMVAVGFGKMVNYDRRTFIYRLLKPTYKGRQVLKIMSSLGYKAFPAIPEAYTAMRSFYHDSPFEEQRLEGLTLLTFLLLNKEFFAPSVYSPTLFLNRVLQKIERDPTSASNVQFTSSYFKDFFDDLRLTYEDDYFTQAWQSPNNILADGSNIASGLSVAPYGVSARDLETYNQQFNSDLQNANGVDSIPYFAPSSLEQEGGVDATASGSNIPSDGWFSVDIHNLAQRLKDYIRRKILAGSRVEEAIKAETGVDVPDKHVNHPVYLGTHNVGIQISQVTNSSASDGAVLGEYGAKGESIGGGHFHYKAEERGIFMIICSLLPALDVVTGCNRDHFDVYCEHEFHADYEGKFMQPIWQIEKLANPTNFTSHFQHTGEMLSYDEAIRGNLAPFQIYGFQQGYAHLKSPQNFMSGDFTLGENGVNHDLAYYHLGYVQPIDENTTQQGVNIAQRNLLYVDGVPYDRIFNVTDNSVDHFFGQIWFDVKLRSKMKSISKCWDVNGSGDSVELQSNGSRFN